MRFSILYLLFGGFLGMGLGGCTSGRSCPAPVEIILDLNAPFAQIDSTLGLLMGCDLDSSQIGKVGAALMVSLERGLDTLRGDAFLALVDSLPNRAVSPDPSQQAFNEVIDRPARFSHWAEDSAALAKTGISAPVFALLQQGRGPGYQWLSYGAILAFQEDRQPMTTDGRLLAGWCGSPPGEEDLRRMPFPPPYAPHLNFEKAKACSKSQKKPLLVYFSGIICLPCLRLNDLFRQKDIETVITENYVFSVLTIDEANPLPDEMQPDGGLLSVGDYGTDIMSYEFHETKAPLLVILSPEGTEISRKKGFIPPTQLLDFLQEGLHPKKN